MRTLEREEDILPMQRHDGEQIFRALNKRKRNSEDPCADFVKTVVGSEALEFVPEDNFDGSLQERKISRMFFPEEQHHSDVLESYRDFGSFDDTQLDDDSYGLPKDFEEDGFCEKSGLALPSVEDGNLTCGLALPSMEDDGNPTCGLALHSVEEDNPTCELALHSVEDDNPTCRLALPSVEDGSCTCRLALPSVEYGNPACGLALHSAEDDNPACGLALHSAEGDNPACELALHSGEDDNPTCGLALHSAENDNLICGLALHSAEADNPTCFCAKDDDPCYCHIPMKRRKIEKLEVDFNDDGAAKNVGTVEKNDDIGCSSAERLQVDLSKFRLDDDTDMDSDVCLAEFQNKKILSQKARDCASYRDSQNVRECVPADNDPVLSSQKVENRVLTRSSTSGSQKVRGHAANGVSLLKLRKRAQSKGTKASQKSKDPTSVSKKRRGSKLEEASTLLSQVIGDDSMESNPTLVSKKRRNRKPKKDSSLSSQMVGDYGMGGDSALLPQMVGDNDMEKDSTFISKKGQGCKPSEDASLLSQKGKDFGVNRDSTLHSKKGREWKPGTASSSRSQKSKLFGLQRNSTIHLESKDAPLGRDHDLDRDSAFQGLNRVKVEDDEMGYDMNKDSACKGLDIIKVEDDQDSRHSASQGLDIVKVKDAEMDRDYDLNRDSAIHRLDMVKVENDGASRDSSAVQELDIVEVEDSQLGSEKCGNAAEEEASLDPEALRQKGFLKERTFNKDSKIRELQSCVRERAKRCLLAAGWKIELKERVNRREYKDSVYVAPWGSSYWSLPKAWSMLRKRLKPDLSKIDDACDESSKQEGLKGMISEVDSMLTEMNGSSVHLDKMKDSPVDCEKDDIVECNGGSSSATNPLLRLIVLDDLSLLRKRPGDRGEFSAIGAEQRKRASTSSNKKKGSQKKKTSELPGFIADESLNSEASADDRYGKLLNSNGGIISINCPGNVCSNPQYDSAQRCSLLGNAVNLTKQRKAIKQKRRASSQAHIEMESEDEMQILTGENDSMRSELINVKKESKQPNGVPIKANRQRKKRSNKLYIANSDRKAIHLDKVKEEPPSDSEQLKDAIARKKPKEGSRDQKKKAGHKGSDLKIFKRRSTANSMQSIRLIKFEEVKESCISCTKKKPCAEHLHIPDDMISQSEAPTLENFTGEKQSGIETGLKTPVRSKLPDDDNITLATMLKGSKRGSKVVKPFSSTPPKCGSSRKKTNTPLTKKKDCWKGSKLSARDSSKRGGARLRGDKGSVSTRKYSITSWLIDVGVLSEKELVKCVDSESLNVLKEGWITRDGILCKCCRVVFTASKFKKHSVADVEKPFSTLSLSSGKSITACQIEAWSSEYKSRGGGMRIIEVDESDQNDDCCGFCGDGGDLICCDTCPSTFHPSCLRIEDVPEGSWYCPNCICNKCRPLNQSEESTISNLVSCKHCEQKYHESCGYNEHNHQKDFDKLSSLFCSEECEKVYSGLCQLQGLSNPTEQGLSWLVLRCFEEDQMSPSCKEFEAMAECNIKLVVALAIMQECFEPMLDPRTGIDMIPHVIYSWGSNFRRLNYQRFYTIILEKGDEIVSVASIRIHGKKFAEMPLIGTSRQYRRQGMCRRLVKVIEEMLVLLGVEKLILSALPDLLETWTKAFGFNHLKDSDKEEVKGRNIMTFPGTILLYKYLHSTPLENANTIGKFQDDASGNDVTTFDGQEQGDELLLEQKHEDRFLKITLPSESLVSEEECIDEKPTPDALIKIHNCNSMDLEVQGNGIDVPILDRNHADAIENECSVIETFDAMPVVEVLENPDLQGNELDLRMRDESHADAIGNECGVTETCDAISEVKDLKNPEFQGNGIDAPMLDESREDAVRNECSVIGTSDAIPEVKDLQNPNVQGYSIDVPVPDENHADAAGNECCVMETSDAIPQVKDLKNFDLQGKSIDVPMLDENHADAVGNECGGVMETVDAIPEVKDLENPQFEANSIDVPMTDENHADECGSVIETIDAMPEIKDLENPSSIESELSINSKSSNQCLSDIYVNVTHGCSIYSGPEKSASEC